MISSHSQRSPTEVSSREYRVLRKTETRFPCHSLSKLSKVANGTNTREITFGALNRVKFNADSLTTFTDVNVQGSWESAMDSVNVDGNDLGLTGYDTILDTSTTLTIAPTACGGCPFCHGRCNQMGAESDGQGGFTITCGSIAQIALSQPPLLS